MPGKVSERQETVQRREHRGKSPGAVWTALFLPSWVLQMTTGTMSTENVNGLTLTEEQVEMLELNFNKGNKYPDPTTLLLIAAEVGLSEEQTQNWFKKRLAQWRESEGLPSESRSVTD